MGSVHDLLRLLADCSELHTINYLNPDTDWLTNSPAVSRIVATPVAERRQQPARGGQVGDYNRVFAESDPQNKSKRTQDIEN